MSKKLYRNEYNRVRGGVCAGLAEYFEIDVTIVRLLFVLSIFAGGAGIIIYIILWIVLPRKGYLYNQFNNITVDYTVPPQQPGSQQFTPEGNPIGGNQWGNNPFANKPFTNASFENTPFMQPRQKSNAGMIIGLVLIMVGIFVLIDNFDLIPDFDFEKIWPVILVIVGGALILTGQKHDWHKHDLDTPVKNEGTLTDNPATDDTAAI